MVREIVPPPPVTSVVVVEPPVTVTRAPSLTSCQHLFADGVSYTYAYNAWVNAGRPGIRASSRTATGTKPA
ncbi:hypothetical protein ABT256_20025 [Amycolatopsis japonica]|uniref:hypothetical protein n=1 Tax=Amycolatopsis japonica TaxID=208439 RepID=UPI00331C36D9